MRKTIRIIAWGWVGLAGIGALLAILTLGDITSVSLYAVLALPGAIAIRLARAKT